MNLNQLINLTEYFDITLYEMSGYDAKNTGLSNGTKLWLRAEPIALPDVKYRIKLIDPQHGDAVFTLWGDEAKQVAGRWFVSGKDLKKIQILIKLLNNELRANIDGLIDSADLTDALRLHKDEIQSI